ncbi:hypothetical protein J4226_04320 [Candidatus Pacearchaeota archaeon]|nr:hypothetical protein [Candidatus Pacearchaeota archaeon]
MGRKKGCIGGAGKFINEKPCDVKKNIRFLEETLDNPNSQDPRTFSAIYYILSRAEKAKKELSAEKADHFYNLANKVLDRMDEIGHTKVDIYDTCPHRLLSGDEQEKINSLQGLLYRASDGKYGEKQAVSGMTKYSGVVATVGLIGGMFLLSSHITGNSIANLSINSTSWAGSILFLAGLTASFFWMKRKVYLK